VGDRFNAIVRVTTTTTTTTTQFATTGNTTSAATTTQTTLPATQCSIKKKNKGILCDGNRMTSVTQIIDALSTMTEKTRKKIKKFEISNNPNFPFIELLWILPQMTGLRSINLKNNDITHLAPEIFVRNKNLKAIDLSGNDITCAAGVFDHLKSKSPDSKQTSSKKDKDDKDGKKDTTSKKDKKAPKMKKVNMKYNNKVYEMTGLTVFKKKKLGKLAETFTELANQYPDLCDTGDNFMKSVVKRKGKPDWYVPIEIMEKWTSN
jgi:Leucine-rich repeat (LRR) protein